MEKLRLFTLLCVVCRLTHAVVTEQKCDPGWKDMLNSCYMVVNNRSLTYPEAYYECIKNDADLMYFDTPTELNSFQTLVSGAPSAAYWTSLNDLVNQNLKAPGDGVWKWGPVSYINVTWLKWSKSPGNDGKALCGGINLQGNMYDADCNSQQGYICNIDSAAAQSGCPLGWLSTQTDCYYVSNTSDPSQLMTWQQAKQQCVTLSSNAHLITIDDVNDQTFLVNQLPYLSQTTYLHWTGLQGSGQAGGWTWFNGATFNQQLFSWAAEPDNVAGMENCAAVRYNGKFTDRGCNTKLNGYICKKPHKYTLTSFNYGCGSWRRANQKCYLFHSADQLTWSAAKQTCTSMHGDLINIKDIDTKTWLQLQMQDSSLNKRFWTALNDKDTEGVYRWGDGTLLNTNTINWNTEPNNWAGNEDCAVIMTNGQFNDVPCTINQLPLCEIDNVQVCPTKGGTWVSMTSDTGSGYNCYLFPDYTNKANAKNKFEATDFCHSLFIQKTGPSGQTQLLTPKLYSVDSAKERDFIKKQLQSYLNSPYTYWTELNDQQTEGFWMFGTNALSDTSFVEWGLQPSALTADMDCVFVWWGANFYTQKCGVKMSYICERQAFGLGTGAGLHGKGLYTSIVLLLMPVIIRIF